MTEKTSKRTPEVDIVLWCDGTWCYKYELSEYSEFMSDDFSIIKEDTLEWENLVEPNKK